MIFTACESGGDVEEENGGTPFVPEITISPKDLTFDCNGGKQAVYITANFEYEVAERASWLTVKQTNEGLLVVVDANKNTSERSAYISIINEKYSITKTIDIVQEAWVPKIELAQQSVEVEFEPAEYEVGVTSPFSWEATTKNDWIVVESERGIAGDEKLKFTTLRNEEEKERKGTITLKNRDYNLVAELYITQKAFVPDEMIIEPESLAFAVEGGKQEIAITANFEYEYSTNADWLTIKKSEKGISVTAQNNVEVENRTAEITISNEKYGVSKVVNVTQGAFVPAITIEPESLAFAVEGGTQEIAITANFEYEYSTNADWLTIKKSEKGVNISAAQNTKLEECIAEITISSEKYGISKAITITQQGVSAESQNVIIYTSSNGKIVTPNNKRNVFGANIVSNIYSKIHGQGIIIFDGPVTLIGMGAFSDCSSLTSITIGNSVTLIGYEAFSDCSSLTSVTIGNSVTKIGDYAFEYCSSLTSVTIPDSVTSIEYGAFSGCKSLKSITIPDSVTSIESSVFSGCTSLTSVTIPDSVTSIGNSAFSRCSSLTSVTIPDSVTSIEAYAFCDCTSLTSVTIPDSVTSMEYGAFDGCTSLTDTYVNITNLATYATKNNIHNLPGDKHILVDGKEITKLVIPNSVTSIGYKAFYKCSSLKSITIPNSVTSIGDWAFYGCTGELTVNCNIPSESMDDYGVFYGTKFTKITIGDSVTSIGGSVFYNCTGELIINSKKIVETGYTSYNDPMNNRDWWLYGSKFTKLTIGNSVTSIGNDAFKNCTSLTSVTIGNSVTSIEYEAFSNCSSLTSVTIGNSVTKIGYEAFSDCSSLTSVTIGNSVTSIGSYAFSGCSSLTSVTIGNSVTSIGQNAFKGCSSLTSVTIGKGVTSIGDRAFYGCTGELTVNCNIPSASKDEYGAFYGSEFTKVTIGNSVTSIGDYAFNYCSSLTSVTIGNRVTKIGKYAFYGCTGELTVNCNIPSASSYEYSAFYRTKFTKITIGDSVTSIGDYAFNYCSSLTSVTIGNSVTKIGKYAFSYCTSLKEVNCKPTTPPVGSSTMFDNNAADRKIYVPVNSVGKYKSAQYWKNYASYIVGYDF